MTPSSGAARLLSIVATAHCSRADLVTLSGLARTTVSQHLGFLFSAGFLIERAETLPSGGGRPARVLGLNPAFAVTLVADIGESRARLAVTDLNPEILVETTIDVNLQDNPEVTLLSLVEAFGDLLIRLGRSKDAALGLGLGLPAPVDFSRGRVVGPSIMPRWDGFDIPAWFAENFDVPVTVENDVNLLALFEHRAHWADVHQLLFIKAGSGIGSGIIADAHLYRGAQGAAGDMGHIQKDALQGPLCRCGKLGCLEATAAGWALIRDLADLDPAPTSVREVVALARSGAPAAVKRMLSAGKAIGETVAGVVSVLNPSVIVVGGSFAGAGELILSGIRELIYQRSLPLATRELTVATALGGADASLKGAAQLVVERQLGSSQVDATFARFCTEARSPERPSGGRPALIV